MAGCGEWCLPLVAAVNAPGNESAAGMVSGAGVESTPSRCPSRLGKAPVMGSHRAVLTRAMRACWSVLFSVLFSVSSAKTIVFAAIRRLVCRRCRNCAKWMSDPCGRLPAEIAGGRPQRTSRRFQERAEEYGRQFGRNEPRSLRQDAGVPIQRKTFNVAFSASVAWATSGCFAGILSKNARV